jgi:hypothetical protein
MEAANVSISMVHKMILGFFAMGTTKKQPCMPVAVNLLGILSLGTGQQ